MADSYWDKFTRQRISRRRALQSAGAAGAAEVALQVLADLFCQLRVGLAGEDHWPAVQEQVKLPCSLGHVFPLLR